MAEKRLLPSLTALRAFEAAARHLSFRLAADEMNVTPSAVSHAVANLEAFLDIKLFHRRTRQLLLTDAGSAYLSPVTQAFDAISAVTREISARSQADILTVASAPTFAKVWLIPHLKMFLDRHPDVDLRIYATIDAVASHRLAVSGAHDPFGKLLGEEADAAIVYGLGGWHGLAIDKLIDEVVVPLCSPALRDGTPRLCSPADLVHHTLIHTETKVVTWSMWLEAAGVAGVAPNRILRLNRAELALNAAVAGLGVALDNRMIAEPHLASGALVIPFDPTVALKQMGAYYFICRPEKVALPKVEGFREWVIEAARETRTIGAPVEATA